VQSARIVGKVASFVSFVALALLIADWEKTENVVLYVLYVAIALTYIATIDYLCGALRIQSNVS